MLADFHQRKTNHDFLRLDLANNDHYEYAKHRLEEAAAAEAASASSATKTSAQQTPTPRRDFARALRTLEVARVKALSQDPNPTKPTEWHCDHFLQVMDARAQGGKGPQAEKVQDTQPALRVGPYATCAGGAHHVFTDVTAYESDLAGKKLTVLAKNASDETDDGKTFDDTSVTVRPSLEANRKVIVESMMVAKNDETNEEHITFATLETSLTPEATSYALEHPRLATPGTTTLANITTCQLRGGSDCDYAMVSNASGTLAPFGNPAQTSGVALRKTGTPWTGDPEAYFAFFPAGSTFDTTNIYIPMKGTFSAGASAAGDCIIQSLGPLTKVRLIKTDTGGTCTTTADLTGAFPVGAKLSSISQLVNVSQTTTPSGGPACTMERILNEAVTLSMTVQASALCGTVTLPRLYTMNSPALPVNPFKLNVLNSCMAEGTRITKADGTRAPIETLKVGDKVQANASGRVLTVQDFIFGHELKPLVRLRDDQGHDVRLTEKHPVLLSSGLVIPAEKVQVKDTVRTQTGTATITATERVPYDGKVYNLKLGTAEELESLGPNERTMFAEGLLVGDDTMQRELTSPRRAEVGSTKTP